MGPRSVIGYRGRGLALPSSNRKTGVAEALSINDPNGVARVWERVYVAMAGKAERSATMQPPVCRRAVPRAAVYLLLLFTVRLHASAWGRRVAARAKRFFSHCIDARLLLLARPPLFLAGVQLQRPRAGAEEVPAAAGALRVPGQAADVRAGRAPSPRRLLLLPGLCPAKRGRLLGAAALRREPRPLL